MDSNRTNMACPNHITIKSSRGAFLSQDKSIHIHESHNILLYFFFAFGNQYYEGRVRKRMLTVLPMDGLEEIKRQVLFLTIYTFYWQSIFSYKWATLNN